MKKTPTRMYAQVKSLSRCVTGVTSPYPTVVIVTIEKYAASSSVQPASCVYQRQPIDMWITKKALAIISSWVLFASDSIVHPALVDLAVHHDEAAHRRE